MVSAAESVASVPLSNIAALQELLLAKHSLSAPATHHITHPFSHGTSSPSGALHSVTALDSADLLRSPLPSPPRHRLSASKPASAAEMPALVHGTPPQNAFHSFTRAEAFHGYADGDTQPMDTQVYRDYRDSVIKPSKTVLNVDVFANDGLSMNDTANPVDTTPHTLVEGEPGYVDLSNAWRPDSPLVHGNSDDIDDLLATPPETQVQAPAGEERRTTPQTPSVAGRKHSRDGETLTSASATKKQTPQFSQLFGMAAKPAAMTATQLFHQTQAPSSPVPDEPRSDPLYTRPSPNLHHNHIPMSSQPIPTSSPETRLRARLPSSTAIEPRHKYFPMYDSQQRRAARLREELGITVIKGDDDDDEGDSQDRRLHLKRLHRLMSDQALHEFSRVKTRLQPGLRAETSQTQAATVDVKTAARIEFALSGDEDTDDEDILMNEDDHEKPSTNGENDDDIYDELGQTVLKSQVDEQDDEEEDEDQLGNGSASNDCEHLDEKDQLQRGFEGKKQNDKATARKSGAALAHPQHPVITTSPSAIADSQPDPTSKSSADVSKHSGLQSSLSYIPGSQYVGITSEDKAHMPRSRCRLIAASQPVPNDRLPSSPPVRTSNSAVPEDLIAPPVARQQLLDRFQDQTDKILFSPTDESQVTYLAGPTATIPKGGAVPSKSEKKTAHVPFSTAQKHSPPPDWSPIKANNSPLKGLTSQHSGFSAESPRRAAGVRRFAEIAADPSPPTASGESQVDINAIMSDVLTADDEAFIAAMSDRTQKPTGRKKVGPGSATNERPEVAQLCILDGASSEERHLGEVLLSTSEFPEGNFSLHQSHARPSPGAPANEELVILRSSQSKEIDGPASTPENALPPKSTQDSVRRREAAGARAVSKLVSGRRRRPVVRINAYPPKLARKDMKKTIIAVGNELPEDALEKNVEDAESNSLSHISQNGADNPPLKRQKHKNSQYQHSRYREGQQFHGAVQEAKDQRTATTHSSAAQHRIFALFKGRYNNFYPATWLSCSADRKTYKVRFDDTTVTNIDPQHVRALKLCIGDQVKVDKPGMRKDVWLIKDFGKVSDIDEAHDYGIDINGHTTVKVQAKISRNGLSASEAAAQSEGELKEVQVTDIYLTHTMWPIFAGRNFSIPGSDTIMNTSESRPATPSASVQTPDVETPVSRSRRSTNPTLKIRNGKQENSILREDSSISVTSRVRSLVFGGMAFAISYGSNESEKADVTRLIQRNGGLILEGGFDELFELPNLDDNGVISPRAEVTGESGLKLKSKYAHLGFVALIADRYSRRAKYMQALALGLPTLSGRWIVDCLHAAADPNNLPPPPWWRYLLPAGESVYLSGAVRSRTIQYYDATTATVANIIAGRELLLNGDGVLIVAAKKNKAMWERRKAYAFLTLALGAGAVRRVDDMKEVKALTSSMDGVGRRWKWVYVEGSVAEACTSLFGRRGAGSSMKRKRNNDDGVVVGKANAKAMSASDGNVKIVNDEFVVQSLILGALVE
ncbi:MAG: hypothetical protein FE78DRAFT_71476 [Acidomyces sp. 'richmondensis']|nr:MAG: hypothetical protein FE78DRAFT_71476 [Acidomyces sp. 'richmondensis']